MSIHLDPFNAQITDKGISFFADVNGKRVNCLLSNGALSSLKNGSGITDPLQLFKDKWPQIIPIMFAKIQKNNFQFNGDLILHQYDVG